MSIGVETVTCDLCGNAEEIVRSTVQKWRLHKDLDLCPACIELLKGTNVINNDSEDTAWSWIESTEQLQIDYFGNDLRAKEGDELDKHILYNVTAALDELHEALAENPSWKPWSTETGVLNREAFKGELVDVMHFIANLIILGKIEEDEFWEAYRAKQQRNRDRMSKSGGYQASKNKCPRCKRELDKPGAYTHKGQIYLQDGTDHKIKHALLCHGCTTVFELVLNVGESLPNDSARLQS